MTERCSDTFLFKCVVASSSRQRYNCIYAGLSLGGGDFLERASTHIGVGVLSSDIDRLSYWGEYNCLPSVGEIQLSSWC